MEYFELNDGNKIPAIGFGVFMIPASLDTVQVYYNVDLFTKSGVDLPKADWAWDQWIAACQTIMAKNPGVYCIDESNWWVHYVPFIRGYGGDVLSPDGKNRVEGYQMLIDFARAAQKIDRPISAAQFIDETLLDEMIRDGAAR